MTEKGVPPGWFEDHEDPARQRWWTGLQWSNETRPVPMGNHAKWANRYFAGAVIVAGVALLLFVLLSA